MKKQSNEAWLAEQIASRNREPFQIETIARELARRLRAGEMDPQTI